MSTFTWKRLLLLVWIVTVVVSVFPWLSLLGEEPLFSETADGPITYYVAFGWLPGHFVLTLLLVWIDNPFIWNWFGLYQVQNARFIAAKTARADARGEGGND